MFCSSIYFRVQTRIEKEIKSALRNEYEKRQMVGMRVERIITKVAQE